MQTLTNCALEFSYSCNVDKILQDFESSVLKEEWEKRQKMIMAKTNERRLQDFQFQEALKERMAAIRQHHAQVQESLDERTEALQARFADVAVELQHDAARLRDQYLSPQPDSSQPSCLDVRTKLATCFKQNVNNSKICDDYVEALNVCMQKRLLASP
jgi:predicted RNA-binding protein with EMAP domain